jgi:hypothetical protein
VRAKDNAGNTGSYSNGSDGILVDLDGPSTPVVTDDGEYTFSTTQIHATWTATDEESGIAEYQYAVSTTQTEAGIISGGDWESVGTATEDTRSGLSLEYDQTYYVLVKAKNGAGLWSEIGASDGITVTENVVIQPLSLKNRNIGGGDWFYDDVTGAGQKGVKDGFGLNNIGLPVRTWGIVTYAGSDYFYLDDGSLLKDGSGEIGIKVQATGLTIPAKDAHVVISGISSCFKVGSDLHPMIRVRRQSAIVPYP